MTQLVLSHNLTHFDPRSTSPVPKSHLNLSQVWSCFSPISNSPDPKSHIVLSRILSCFGQKSTSPVPKRNLVMLKKSSHYYSNINFSCPPKHLALFFNSSIRDQIASSLALLVRSFSIILRPCFHCIIIVTIILSCFSISPSWCCRVTLNFTLHISQYHPSTINWFDIAKMIFSTITF